MNKLTFEGKAEAPRSSRAMSGRALSRDRCRLSSRASYWATDSEPPALPEERGRRFEVPVLRLKYNFPVKYLFVLCWASVTRLLTKQSGQLSFAASAE